MIKAAVSALNNNPSLPQVPRSPLRCSLTPRSWKADAKPEKLNLVFFHFFVSGSVLSSSCTDGGSNQHRRGSSGVSELDRVCVHAQGREPTSEANRLSVQAVENHTNGHAGQPQSLQHLAPAHPGGEPPGIHSYTFEAVCGGFMETWNTGL